MPSDDRAPYSGETRNFARQLSLKPRFTPVKSPPGRPLSSQSKGISEAFVNTLKRDYVRVIPLPDAKTVIGLIAEWVEDDNRNHPHSGLNIRPSREFITVPTATA